MWPFKSFSNKVSTAKSELDMLTVKINEAKAELGQLEIEKAQSDAQREADLAIAGERKRVQALVHLKVIERYLESLEYSGIDSARAAELNAVILARKQKLDILGIECELTLTSVLQKITTLSGD